MNVHDKIGVIFAIGFVACIITALVGAYLNEQRPEPQAYMRTQCNTACHNFYGPDVSQTGIAPYCFCSNGAILQYNGHMIGNWSEGDKP